MNLNRILLSFFLAVAFSASLFAQTGKIAGTVVDGETGEPLPFANVIVNGTSMGAATDLEGNFVILNVAPGVYEVTASLVGFQKKTVKDVRVNVDFTTTLEFEIVTGSIDLPAIIVQGERNPLIRQDATNPTVAITSETIDELPVDNIADVIKLQAGVVVGNDGELHFRGGYGNEVAYTLNGVSLNDPYNNSRSIGLATNAVQEVSVSTGTFSAEYGNALSGVVNYVTKEGGEKYTFSLRGYGGDYVTNRDELYMNIDDINPLNRARTEFTFGGPIPFSARKVKFFLSSVYEKNGGYLSGKRLYNSTDSYLPRNQFPSDHELNGSSTLPFYFNPYDTTSTGLPTGDGEYVSLNSSESFNLQGNISFAFTPTLKLKFESVYDYSTWDGGGNWGSLSSTYAPDGRGSTYQNGLHNAVEFTHTVNQNVFYTIKTSYTINESEYYLYEDVNDPGYLPSLYANTLANTTFYTGGTDNYRYNRQTKTTGVKGDLVAQMFTSHEVKFGFEVRLFEIDYESYSIQFGKYDVNSEGNFAQLNTADLFNDDVQIIRRVPSDPNQYTSYHRTPSQFSVYLRDKIELSKSMVLNAGVRYEYFDPKAQFNDNLSNEYHSKKSGLMSDNLKDAEVKHMISPRISVSYPITDKGIIRFSYGHFYQNGSLSSFYKNPNFYASLGSTPSFGNPDVKPQRSVQYELGLNQALTEDFRLELTGYYKDVKDYIQTQTIYTVTGEQYSVLSNLSYSNVRGITLSLFKRRAPQSLFQASLDYTFQIAEGNRTYPSDEIFFSEAAGKQTETYLVPLAFDRPHVINATINLIDPDNWTLGLVGYLQLGTPYTPVLPASYSTVTYEQNSASRPTQWNLDFKFEKYFNFGDFKYSVFLQVENLFDTQNEIGVYSSTGRALNTLDQVENATQFSDLRNRIVAGDGGLVPLKAIDNYYERAQNLSRPREVRLGFSIIFN